MNFMVMVAANEISADMQEGERVLAGGVINARVVTRSEVEGLDGFPATMVMLHLRLLNGAHLIGAVGANPGLAHGGNATPILAFQRLG